MKDLGKDDPEGDPQTLEKKFSEIGVGKRPPNVLQPKIGYK